MKKQLFLITTLVTLFFSNHSFSQDQMLGEVKLFAGNFAPRNWAFCEGQLLNISENTALFSILGTMYGGDGRTTFALPDLRGKVPVGVGTEVRIGETVNSGSKGDDGAPGLGMHYIIALNGLYPSRQ